MERLTQTSNLGGVAFTFDLDITCKPSEAQKILKLAEKLKAYEDAEDQGLLLRLPCNKVWFICDKGTEYATVMSKDIDDLTGYEVRKIDRDGRYWSTKEKAEAKLEEMEGAE